MMSPRYSLSGRMVEGRRLFSGVAVILLLYFPGFPVFSDGFSSGDDPVNNLILVGGDAGYPPYEFLDKDGKPAGFIVDLTRAIAGKMGLNIQIGLGTWDRVYGDLMSGEIDMLQGVYFSSERARDIAFSPAHSVVRHTVVTRKDAPPVRALKDLEGREILVQKGDIMDGFVTGNGWGSRTTGLANPAAVLEALAGGQGDCALVPEIPALYYIEEYGLSRLQIHPLELPVQEYCYGTLHENARMILIFSEGLAALQASGEYREIYSRWFGRYEQDWYGTRELIRKILLLLVLPLVLLLGIISAWSRTLAHRVKLRTKELHTAAEQLKFRVADLEASRASLEESEARHREILHTAMDGFWMVGPGGEFREVNESYCRMSGYTREELLSLNIRDVEALEGGDLVGHHILRVRTLGQDRFCSRHRRKDGSVYDVEVSAQYSTTDQGCFVVFVQDISARVQAEKESLGLQKQLAQAQKMESIGRLAGGIAHDFNNQLAGILGFSEMLLASLEDEGLKQYARNIHSSAQNSARLTQQLLSFARKGQFSVQEISVAGLLEEVEAILTHTIDRQINVVCLPGGEDLVVEGDRSQLQNALLNIALNARDAIRGRGMISVEALRVEIGDDFSHHLFQLSPGRYVRIDITDDGCGMDEVLLKNIFDPFFTTKEVGKGTGMGLAAAYGTIKNHGGGILVDSRPGEGSTFRILLPLKENPSLKNELRNAEEPEVLMGAAENSNHILVVDDDPMIRELVKDLLSSLEYRVTLREDGESAIEYFRLHASGVDLVILDMIMPKKSGLEIFNAMKMIDPGVKVLLSSGYSPDDAAIAELADRETPFIQKPYTLSDLSEAVSRILNEE